MPGGKRSLKQNAALHLWFKQTADALNEAGLDIRTVLKPEVEIPWSPYTIKEFLWKPVMKAYLGKRSTTEMTIADVSEIYEILNRHLSSRLGEFAVHIPWPSLDELEKQL